MKILIKDHQWQGNSSLVVLSDPEKEKKIMRFLICRNYANAIRFILNCGGETKIIQEERIAKTDEIDLVLTPKSVHWDLIG